MALPKLNTLGDLLYWSYANLAMMANVLDDNASSPVQVHFKIRSKLFAGLRSGRMRVGSFLDDERLKGRLPQGCWYCGGAGPVTADHVIARVKGGKDRGENLVFACRSCNSSKGSKDMIAWMADHGRFPPLYLLRRYLKLAIEHCETQGLMSLSLDEAVNADLPFDVSGVPRAFPPASKLCKSVPPRDP